MLHKQLLDQCDLMFYFFYWLFIWLFVCFSWTAERRVPINVVRLPPEASREVLELKADDEIEVRIIIID